MQNKNTTIIIVLLAIIVGVLVFIDLRKPKTEVIEVPVDDTSVTQQPLVNQNQNAKKLAPDVYPLYPKVSWGQEITKTLNYGGTQFLGFQVDSQKMGDDQFSKTRNPSFSEYYEAQLLARGWNRSQNIAADGAGSSIWGYTKGDEFIILSYRTLDLNPQPDQEFTCPCETTLSVFSGKLK